MLDNMGWVFLLGGRKHPNYEYIGDFYNFMRLLYIPRPFLGLGFLFGIFYIVRILIVKGIINCTLG